MTTTPQPLSTPVSYTTAFQPSDRVRLIDASYHTGTLTNLQNGMLGIVVSTEPEFVNVQFDGDRYVRNLLPYRLEVVSDQAVQPWEEHLSQEMYKRGAFDALAALRERIGDLAYPEIFRDDETPEEFERSMGRLEGFDAIGQEINNIRQTIQDGLDG